MDYNELRSRVARLQHEEHSNEEEQYLVAIVPHVIKHVGRIANHSDVFWKPSSGEMTIKMLKEAYLHETFHGLLLGSSPCHLAFDEDILNADSPVNELDKYGDQLIVLHAMKTDAPIASNSQENDSFSTQGSQSALIGDVHQRPLKLKIRFGENPEAQHQDRLSTTVGAKREENINLRASGAEALKKSLVVHLPVAPGRGHLTEFSVEKHRNIQKIQTIKDAQVLAKTVEEISKPLLELEKMLQEEPIDPDRQMYLDRIAKTKSYRKSSAVTIAVVGSTGAGKSSLINALLGEENVVPTGDVFACTTTVTEVAFNEDGDPEKLYRAEIEYITRAQWEKELRVLLKDIIGDRDCLSVDCSKPQSNARIAYTKFKAVYPEWKDDDIAAFARRLNDINDLLDTDHIKECLGETKRISSAALKDFHVQLRQYIETRKKAPGQFERWPLIKVVRIFLKADILATGIILADCPGGQDSNVAQTTVTRDYLQKCNAVWIVAPIHRAVSDRAAQELLLEQFGRQMQFDGLLLHITFICSKTDEITIHSAAHSLGLGAEYEKFEAEQQKLVERSTVLQNELEVIENQKARAQLQQRSAHEKRLEWLEETVSRMTCQLDPKHGDIIIDTRKRAAKSSVGPNKRHKADQLPNDLAIESREPDELGGNGTTAKASSFQQHLPSVNTAAHAKTQELKLACQEIDDEVERLGRSERLKKHELDEVALMQDQVLIEIRNDTIKTRNTVARTFVRQGFVMGVKKLDQIEAERRQGENFDPSVDIRDYNKLEQDLHVFCASSKAYQMKCGRFGVEGEVSGYEALEDTEIPQLKAHCMKMTESNRISASHFFLESLINLISSIGVWLTDRDVAHKIPDAEGKDENAFLDDLLREFEGAQDCMVDKTFGEAMQHLNLRVQSLYSRAIRKAVTAAPRSASKWSGLFWNTYKATVDRDGGPFKSAKGVQDFNKDLSSPFENEIARSWELCFQDDLPNALRLAVEKVESDMENFHSKLVQRARVCGLQMMAIKVLNENLHVWKQSFNRDVQAVEDQIIDLQRQANRSITPAVTDKMRPTYAASSSEKGLGMSMRMKNHVEGYIEQNSKSMFKSCSKALDKNLAKVPRKIKQELTRSKSLIIDDMRNDLEIAFGLRSSGHEVTEDERVLRDALKDVTRAMKAQLDNFIQVNVADKPADAELFVLDD